jgi:MoxR-like ATPase
VYPPQVDDPSQTDRTQVSDIAATQSLVRAILDNVEQVIVGKRDVITLMLVALFCEGHVLIEDVPGVGKTTLARAIARSIGGEFRRIQFTPDLLPSDISGLSFFDQKLGDFRFRPGPVFANVVLADEINRATPRTQSALLEAMEEHTVTVEGETMSLPRPFLVLATENPIELEGTFPLPEAQLDRFLLRLIIGYPSLDDEVEMLSRMQTGNVLETLESVADENAVATVKSQIQAVHVAAEMKTYIAAIVRATREHEAVELGASPRGSLGLMRAARAYAAIQGRMMVLPDDVKQMTTPVLGHRLMISPEARLRGRTVEHVLAEIVDHVPVPVEDAIGLDRVREA